ncbi:PH and SEC7 domain-containing protein 1 [Betta splendens]|uniref:PH and SEC7 domain-containing protein 1 n=1 Tax=Betta splendens TaxID=158456 RepID=A0A6P7P2Q2_BETSP|nr:PH and SEC7 domain-containing protein 1 [Betta splendens]
MEEERLRCSAAPRQPEADAGTPVQSQCVNGDHETIVWGETEMQIKQSHGTDQPNPPPGAGREAPNEAAPWEHVAWPLSPTLRTGASLSFATVQWDMPGSSGATPPLVTDGPSANGPDGGDSPPPPPRASGGDSAELFAPGEGEEDAGFDPLFLDVEWRGGAYEPCDAEDAQERRRQEVEVTDEPSESRSETSPRTDSEEEEELSSASDPPETVDVINPLEAEGSEDDGDGFVDVRLEEEQEEPGVLFAAQATDEELSEVEEEQEEPGVLFAALENPEEEATAATGVETDDTNEEQRGEEELSEEEEELSDVNASCTEESEELQTVSCSSDVDVPVEPLQTDTGLTVNSDELQVEHLEEGQQSEPEDTEVLERTHEGSTGQTGDPEMCRDVDVLVERELSKETELIEETGHESPSPQMTNASEDQEEQNSGASEQLEPSQRPDQSIQDENVDGTERPVRSEGTVSAEAEEPGVAAQQEQMETAAEASAQPGRAQNAAGPEDARMEEAGPSRADRAEPADRTPVLANGDVDREMARALAQRLFNLDDIQRVDVVKHVDKDNHFSRAVGEEYLKFFDFSGQTLDQALRSFLKVVILIGETQERERVLQHFACRFHQCNPGSFSSSGAALTLTCAVMLLNTDLHGQNVGKSMTSSKFVSNLDEMNEGTNFSKDLLKSLYNSIKNEPLEWAVDDDELKSSMLLEEDTVDGLGPRSKTNPFLDVPHDKNASVVKDGFIRRKVHADIDGKRTPWGKRGWKTFYGVLRGMVLYLQKSDGRAEQQVNEEVVSVHHSLAEQAADYTKKPHVLRLQTADWRVFLFQASSKAEMNSWISRINLVSALHSSPPFPAAVGSQRKFFRPILPASRSAHTLERQLQSHAGMLESFKADLLHLQQNPPENRKIRGKELEEQRVRAEYLQHEISRYEAYIRVLEAWRTAAAGAGSAPSPAELQRYDRATCADAAEEADGEGGGLKKSLSSPSLAVELAPPAVIKVKRNISERRTQRRVVVPRRNKEA